MHCLQVIGAASTQSSPALHQNARAYDVRNLTADKDQEVTVCILVVTYIACTYVHSYTCT